MYYVKALSFPSHFKIFVSKLFTEAFTINLLNISVNIFKVEYNDKVCAEKRPCTQRNKIIIRALLFPSNYEMFLINLIYEIIFIQNLIISLKWNAFCKSCTEISSCSVHATE